MIYTPFTFIKKTVMNSKTKGSSVMIIKIAEIRKRKKFTQQQLSDATGISRPYLAQLESGTRTLNTQKQAIIAKALGVAPSELVDFDAPDKSDVDVIVDAFEQASEEQREIWLAMARAIHPSRK